MSEQNTQQGHPQKRTDLEQIRRMSGLSPTLAGPEPPGTGYASHPAAGTSGTTAQAAGGCAPEEPETERGGSAAGHFSTRTNEDEGPGTGSN